MKSFRFCTFIFVASWLTSCVGIKYTSYPRPLLKNEIKDDVLYLKKNLTENHFNLNWENNEENILSELNSILDSNSDETVKSFEEKLGSVLVQVDDGHTRVFGFEKGEKIKLPRHKYVCDSLDQNIIFLKIPSFNSIQSIKKCLEEYKELNTLKEFRTVVIDFRGNKGGRSKYVAHFLEKMESNEVTYYKKFELLKSRGILGSIRNFIKDKFLGYKTTDSTLYRLNHKIEPDREYKFSFQNKIILVDSTIISGTMLATYHLQNDGFKVYGPQPSSLFNTFGNVKLINLPNSNLYVALSRLRLFVNDNYHSRHLDTLKCDGDFTIETVKEILNKIDQKLLESKT